MQDRTLDESVVLPEIRGEMVKLRAASWEDFSTMDRIHAFSSSLTLVGKSEEAEALLCVHGFSVHYAGRKAFAPKKKVCKMLKLEE